MSDPRPEDLLDQPVPDVTLPSTSGEPFAFRGRVGASSLVLFFYVRNATPG